VELLPFPQAFVAFLTPLCHSRLGRATFCGSSSISARVWSAVCSDVAYRATDCNAAACTLSLRCVTQKSKGARGQGSLLHSQKPICWSDRVTTRSYYCTFRTSSKSWGSPFGGFHHCALESRVINGDKVSRNFSCFNWEVERVLSSLEASKT
jgi:hypothetical protein